MSDEKIDVAEITRQAWACDGTHPDTVLALVAAVRAARDLAHKGYHPRRWPDFVAALAPFTDSAEVRSDGELDFHKRGLPAAELAVAVTEGWEGIEYELDAAIDAARRAGEGEK